MAFPFGGHPTFGEYLAWARERGCVVHSGIDGRTGRPLNPDPVS